MSDDLLPFLELLLDLGIALMQGHVDTRGYLHGVSRLLQRHLGCSQVSVWRLDLDSPQRSALWLTQHPGHRPAGERLLLDQHASYFERLLAQGYLLSADTHCDPTLASVRARYLSPGAPRALLDVMITVNGKRLGILCCEQMQHPRQWSADELTLLRRIGGRVVLQLKAHEALTRSREADPSPVAAPFRVELKLPLDEH